MKVERGRVSRLLAGMLAGAMALSVSPLLGVSPAGAADPLPPLADPVADGAVCDDAPGTNPFDDLGAESAGTREVILCLVATRLTAGTSETTYTPGGTVTRRQMALFVKRLADLVNVLEKGDTELTELPEYDGEPDYPDVADENPEFQEAIGQLTQAEIVGGFPDGTFRPNAPVSRRQMAKFVNELQEFLTGTAYATDNDYFDDDNGDSGEDDLNGLASVGIFAGDGQGQVSPGDDLTRRQMANILLRDAQVLFSRDLIVSPFGTGETTLTMRPADVGVLEFASGIDATTPDDDRVYTASGLPALTSGYQVTLVDSKNVFPIADGTYRFAEDEDTGMLDAGDVTARIVKVNGTTVDARQHVPGIQPQNGTITFTVDGNGMEALTPVISVNAGSNSRLELDVIGRPIERFGVGGELKYVPAEASDGEPVNGTVAVSGADFAAIDGALRDVTVYFQAGDTYRIGSGSTFPVVTPAEFHAALSTGDGLRTCEDGSSLATRYTQGGPNEYCLTDAAPASPTDLTATLVDPKESTVRLEWTAAPVADSYNVFANPETCANTTEGEWTGRASVPARDTSFTVTGLDPTTTYCFLVTTVESGDETARTVGTAEADEDNTVQRTTAGPVEAPTITSARLTTDLETGSLTEDDVITLVFNERMNPDTVEDATFAVTDADGDTTTIVCVAAPGVPLPAPRADDGRTEATCELGDGADATVRNDTLTITIVEDGDDGNTGGGNDAIEYPLTITASGGLQDADDGQTVDVANSPDKTIS